MQGSGPVEKFKFLVSSFHRVWCRAKRLCVVWGTECFAMLATRMAISCVLDW